MATRNKTWDVTIANEGGAFNTFFKKFSREKSAFDFEGLSSVRKLLSNEKARLLHILKKDKPGSIYELAKLLDRDIKSVNEDVKVLERFGFIDMVSEKTGKRQRLRPVLAVEAINIKINV